VTFVTFLRFFDILGFAKKTKKDTYLVTKTYKCHKVQKCDIVTIGNVTKCHRMSHFFKSLVQSYVYLLCLDWARNGSESTVPMHPQPQTFNRQLFLDFRANFFPEWPLNFFVSMIHQVIWPSPGALVRSYF